MFCRIFKYYYYLNIIYQNLTKPNYPLASLLLKNMLEFLI